MRYAEVLAAEAVDSLELYKMFALVTEEEDEVDVKPLKVAGSVKPQGGVH